MKRFARGSIAVMNGSQKGDATRQRRSRIESDNLQSNQRSDAYGKRASHTVAPRFRSFDPSDEVVNAN